MISSSSSSSCSSCFRGGGGALLPPTTSFCIARHTPVPLRNVWRDRRNGSLGVVHPVSAAQNPQESKNSSISSGSGNTQNKFEISSGSTRSQTTSAVASPSAFPPPQPQMGSPIMWIGVGVGISIVFSWAAKKAQGYAMQQALKSMMGQSGQGGNPFFPGQGNNPFGRQGANMFSGGNANPFNTTPVSFPFIPPPASASPPTSASASASTSTASTIDVSVSSPQSEPLVVNVKPKPSAKASFTDVDMDISVEEKTTTHDQRPSPQKLPRKPSFTDAEVIDNNASSSGSSSYGSQGAASQNGKSKSFISVEMLETMLDDPKIQDMVFPYLPEEMRDPVTFKAMIKLPQVRQQLQEALNNMGGDDGMDMMKYMNSDAVKEQFDQIGLTPDEVVGKILASPDIAASLQNPKVVEAIMDCSQNPLNITKYQNDQEVMNALLKIAELFPGATGPTF